MTRLLVCLFALTLVQPQPALAQSASGFPHSNADTLEGDWTQVQLDEACCAFETPYRFFFRSGSDPSRLLIYFQGGGACWSWVSCSGMFDTSVERSELSGFRGIFDFSNPENPFAEYTTVFVPYCTGDVHVGDTVRTYGENTGGRLVHHRGASNAEQVLQWTKAHIENLRQIVVVGASAGSYGAIFHTPRVAELYPSADIITIGDSGVPLLNNHEAVLRNWGAGDLTLENMNTLAATSGPVQSVVHITSDQDAVQSASYLISGSPAWRESSYALLNSLEDRLSNFHSFIVSGADHGLMRTNAFYEYESNGMRLVDWIGRLVDGEPVQSVLCRDCLHE